jgi:hypothetical protein
MKTSAKTALYSAGMAIAASFLVSTPALSARLFTATLNGSQEVPPRTTTGSGSATATLIGGPGSWVLTYTVDYANLIGVIAAPFAHIHNAPFGSNGPIIHDLDGANSPPIAGSQSGTIVGDWRFDDPSRPLTDFLAGQLLAGNLYFNIHTTAFVPGEIRGQIFAVPEPNTLAPIATVAAIAAGASIRRARKR